MAVDALIALLKPAVAASGGSDEADADLARVVALVRTRWGEECARLVEGELDDRVRASSSSSALGVRSGR